MSKQCFIIKDNLGNTYNVIDEISVASYYPGTKPMFFVDTYHRVKEITVSATINNYTLLLNFRNYLPPSIETADTRIATVELCNLSITTGLGTSQQVFNTSNWKFDNNSIARFVTYSSSPSRGFSFENTQVSGSRRTIMNAKLLIKFSKGDDKTYFYIYVPDSTSTPIVTELKPGEKLPIF